MSYSLKNQLNKQVKKTITQVLTVVKLNVVANSATVKRFPQLEVQADADKPFEVSGYSNGSGTGDTYSCGPLKSTFTPERSKVYLVEFQFIGQDCEQHVYDVTQPQQRTPVTSVPAV